VHEDPAAAAPADSAGFVSVESLMANAARNHSPHQSPQGASI
jgi:hypothetical protein